MSFDGGHQCANPICFNIIWDDGFHYGSGKYCDEMCSNEAFGMNNRLKRKNNFAKYNRVREIQQTMFPHKSLPVMLIIE